MNASGEQPWRFVVTALLGPVEGVAAGVTVGALPPLRGALYDNAMADASRFIVCETDGRWTIAFRRAMPAGLRVVETRTLDFCWEQLAAAPESVVAFDCRLSQPDLVRRLARLHFEFPSAFAIALVLGRVPAMIWALRAAGVAHVVTGLRSVPATVGRLQRHVVPTSTSAGTLEEQVLRRLPWRSPPATSASSSDS